MCCDWPFLALYHSKHYYTTKKEKCAASFAKLRIGLTVHGLAGAAVDLSFLRLGR